jgi:hypothetical protein
MSEAIVHSVTQSHLPISALLDQLDSNITNTDLVQVKRGPFSILRLASCLPPEGLQDDDVLAWLDTFLATGEAEASDLSPDSVAHYDLLSSHAQTTPNMLVPVEATSIDEASMRTITMTRGRSRSLSQIGSIYSDDSVPYTLPNDTQELLQHWSRNMDSWFPPLRAKKHPWSVLHLPLALSTVAELTVLRKTKHVKISIFRALLSLSAFVLYRCSTNTEKRSIYWHQVAGINREVAIQEMKQALLNEIHGLHRAKYKELLVALLSLVSVSVSWPPVSMYSPH